MTQTLNEGKVFKDWVSKNRYTVKELSEMIGVSEQAVFFQYKKLTLSDSFRHKLLKSGINPFEDLNISNENSRDTINISKQGLPLFDIYGRAGKTSLINTMENTHIENYVSVPGYEDCIGWVRVKGDSMAPFLNSGDYIALKRVDIHMILYGHVYFIEFSGEFAPEPVVKYIRKGSNKEFWTLRSHNDKYEDTEIPIGSVKAVFTVRGGVIEIQ